MTAPAATLGGVIGATWLKLRRPAVLLPAAAAVMAFAAILASATFLTASRPGGSRLSDPPLTLSDMSAATIPGDLIGRLVMILGAVTLSICAWFVANEYATGSLRTQLIRQPSRLTWLAGTATTLGAFVIALAVLGAATAVVTGFAAAPRYNVDTTAWATWAGGRHALLATADVALALLGFAGAGAALAVLLRSAVAAVGIGLAYGLFEGMTAAVAPGARRWMPGQLLSAVVFGGTDAVSYGAAVTAFVPMVAGVFALTALVFRRRDIQE